MFKVPITLKTKPQTHDLPSFEENELSSLREVGRGTYGIVYVANKNGNRVVVKTSLAKQRHEKALVLKEARLICSHRHDNIVKFLAFNERSSSMLLEFMEFQFQLLSIDKQPINNLGELLQECDDLCDFENFEHMQGFIMKDVISGLAYLHRSNVVHRDLKPDNILVSNQHFLNPGSCMKDLWNTCPVIAKLTDFGEARSDLIQTFQLSRNTRKLVRGSAAFMAPEALLETLVTANLGDLKRMDIWSLGMVAHSMCNPDSSFPYWKEVEESEEMNQRKSLERHMMKKRRPCNLPKYELTRKRYWDPVHEVFLICSVFDSKERPSIEDVQRIFSRKITPKPETDDDRGTEHEMTSSHPNGESTGSQQNADNLRLELDSTDISKVDHQKLSEPNVDEDHQGSRSAESVSTGSGNLREDNNDFEEIPDIIHQPRQRHGRKPYQVTKSLTTVPHEPKDQISDDEEGYAVLGDFHQASDLIFNDAFAGSQCTSMSVMAIVLALLKPPENWTKFTLHQVLIAGHRAHAEALERLGWPENRTDLTVDIDEISEIQTGTLDEQHIQANIGVLTEPQFGMEMKGLINEQVQEEADVSYVLRVGDRSNAILPGRNGAWFVFDSHACQANGMSDPDGSAGLIVFRSKLKLIQHLTRRYPDDGQQIDLFKVNVHSLAEEVIGRRDDRNEGNCSKRDETSPVIGRKDGGNEANCSKIYETSPGFVKTDDLLISSIDSTDETATKPKKKNRYRNDQYDLIHWAECQPRKVEELPHDIDGLNTYHVPCSEKKVMMKVSKDGRPWARYCLSSRKGFSGERRLAHCKGSPICVNGECQFRQMYGSQNRKQFKKESDTQVCFSCGKPAESVECPATKIWEFRKDFVTIMHTGTHTCVATKPKISLDVIEKDLKQNPGITPGKIVSSKMMNLMSSENFQWENIEEVAEQYTDLKRMHNVRQRLKADTFPGGENFEALAAFKHKCDEKDQFFIFRMNNRAFNGEHSYVFKSSKGMVELMLAMDKDGGGVLSREYAYVDGKHDHCKGFVTLTLWVYHPVMRRLVQLAICDTEKEDTTNLRTFWTTINAMVATATETDQKFNPHGFVADENHANWRSIEQVYGEDGVKRTVSCEFHWKQSVHRQAKKMPSHQVGEFTEITNEMLTALTIADYNSACARMTEFMKSGVTEIEHWFNWWHKRRSHIFRAFKPSDAPSSNLAEVGHAKMSSIGKKNMTLLDAAKEDVIGAIRQEAEIKGFYEGRCPGGRGRSTKQKKADQFKADKKRVAAFSKELDRIYVPESGSHRPTEQGPKSKRRKKSQVSNTPKEQRQRNEPTQEQGTATTKKDEQPVCVCLATLVMNLQTCYGCKHQFADKYKKPPNDVILKTFLKRTYMVNGEERVASKTSATYFHLNINCVRMVKPYSQISQIVVHDEVKPDLSEGHKRVLTKFGVHL